MSTVQCTIYPQLAGHRIDPLLFGHFMEHVGTGVDEGIWVGEGSPIANEGGLRLDTLRALQALEVPILRWPGGLWADSYHWMDGVGPRSERPVRLNLGWDKTESNGFGTHEFLNLCSLLGAEPYLCCNIGTGSVDEARNWAEYANGDKDTTLTRLRARNGHPEPYRVRYWGIGNEPYYCLDGMMTDRMYAEVYRRYAGFLKRFAANDVYEYGDAFASVRLVAATASEAFLAEFDATSLRYVDYVAAHFYCDTRPSTPDDVEGGYRRLVVEGLGKLELSLSRAARVAERFSTEDHPIRVALDEWGTWYWDHATPRNGLTQPVTMQDALFGAGCFHALFRSPRVGLANLAQAVNVLSSLIKTEGPGFCLTPMYHLFWLMSPHRGATSLTVTVSGSPAVDFGGTAERAAFDAAATMNSQGDGIYVTAVNYHPSVSLVLRLSVAGDNRWKVVRANRLQADGVREGNTPRDPERVRPEELAVPRGEDLTLPPATILAIAFERTR